MTAAVQLEAMTIGQYIRDTRTAQQMQQRELAARVGVSPQYVNDIELGRRDPGNDVLDRIVAELGLSHGYACWLTGRLPGELRYPDLDEATVEAMMRAAVITMYECLNAVPAPPAAPDAEASA